MSARQAHVLLVLMLLGAGCTSLPAAPPAAEGAGAAAAFTTLPVVALPMCPEFRDVACFEPSIAVDLQGRIFTTPTAAAPIAVSTDGGRSFASVPAPPLPAMALPGRTGDNTVQVDPKGRLWHSALHLTADRQLIAGVQISRSDDAGATWAASGELSLASAQPTFFTDRQWLAFGPGDRVYATYWSYTAGVTFIAASDDAGASWGPFHPAVRGWAGRAGVDPDGRVVLAFYEFRAGAEPLLNFAASGDGGLTFDQVPVSDQTGADQARGAYPSLAVLPSGVLMTTWPGPAGEVLVSVSSDKGATWSKPASWTTSGEKAPPDTQPFVVPVGGTFAVAWYAANDDSRILRVRGGGAEPAPVIHDVATLPLSKPVTDFTDVAVDKDSRLWFVWTDGARGILVASTTEPFRA